MSETHTSRSVVWILMVGAGILIAIRFVWLPTTEEVEIVEEAAEAGEEGTVSFLMEQQWLIQMKLAQAESVLLAPQVRAVGRVIPSPERHAIVAPPVAGILSGSRLPGLGTRVTQGEVIAVLTESPTAAEAASLRLDENRIDAERRRLTEARSGAERELEFASSEVERARRLFARRAFSARQVEGAETAYTGALASLSAIDAQIEALGVGAAPSTYQVRAPISGTVIRVSKRAGERVGAGEVIVELVDTERVWVEVPVFERDLGRISDDPVATFTTLTSSGSEFRSARVIDAGDVIDEATRAAMFVFAVENPDRELRIGMQTNVRLDAGEARETLVIPREAILDNEGQKIVYVLVSGETFERRTVTTGDEYGDGVAILSGLETGERVVTQGAYQLKLQELQPSDPGAHTHEV